MLAGWDNDLGFGARAGIVAALVALSAATKLAMGGLTVLVQERRFMVHMGVVPLVKKSIPFRLYVGDHPRRLEERTRTIARTRIARES